MYSSVTDLCFNGEEGTNDVLWYLGFRITEQKQLEKRMNFFSVIMKPFCSQLHCIKRQNFIYCLKPLFCLYFSIMWLKKHEEILVIFFPLAGHATVWSMTGTFLTPLCTQAPSFNNSKCGAVLWLPPNPRFISYNSL